MSLPLGWIPAVIVSVICLATSNSVEARGGGGGGHGGGGHASGGSSCAARSSGPNGHISSTPFSGGGLRTGGGSLSNRSISNSPRWNTNDSYYNFGIPTDPGFRRQEKPENEPSGLISSLNGLQAGHVPEAGHLASVGDVRASRIGEVTSLTKSSMFDGNHSSTVASKSTSIDFDAWVR